MKWTIKQLKEVVEYIRAEKEEIVKNAKQDYFKRGGRLADITKFTFEDWLKDCITSLAKKDSFIETIAAGEPEELMKQLLAAPASFRKRLWDEYRKTYLRTVFDVTGFPSTYSESDLMDLVAFMLDSRDTAVAWERFDSILSGYPFDEWLSNLIYAVLVKDKKYTEWTGSTLLLKAVLNFYVPAFIKLRMYYDNHTTKPSIAVAPPLIDFFIVHEVPDTDELTVESHSDSEAVGEVRLHSLQSKADAGTLYSDNHTVGYVVLKGEDVLDYYVVPEGYKDPKKVRQRLDKLIEDFLKIGDFFK